MFVVQEDARDLFLHLLGMDNHFSNVFALSCASERAIRDVWGEALLVCFEQLLERESSPNAACASNGFSWIFHPAQVACQTLAA